MSICPRITILEPRWCKPISAIHTLSCQPVRGIDVVFHNAAELALAKNKQLMWSVNRDGTNNLLESCAGSTVNRVIYTFSSAVYGIPKSNPVTEDAIPTPADEYERAKLAGEEN